MGYADHLRALLRPLDVYALDGQSLSGAELEALGEACDGLYAQMQQTLQEALPLTAEDAGLTAYEQLLGCPRIDMTAAQRRAGILGLLRMPANGATPASLLQAADFTGGGIAFDESTLPQALTVTLPEGFTAEEYDEIKRYLRELLPCHLAVTFQEPEQI